MMHFFANLFLALLVELLFYLLFDIRLILQRIVGVRFSCKT